MKELWGSIRINPLFLRICLRSRNIPGVLTRLSIWRPEAENLNLSDKIKGCKMSLALDEYGYANSYYTNWEYLQNITELLMKALEEMEWNRAFEIIHDDLEPVPVTYTHKNIEYSIELFINDLNNAVKWL
jgi:hypothetical protein